MIFANGFEKALLGAGRQAHRDVAVYDYDKCVRILMKREKWTEEEALEWMEYNVVGAYVGESTPVFVMMGQMPDDE